MSKSDIIFDRRLFVEAPNQTLEFGPLKPGVIAFHKLLSVPETSY